MSTSLTLITANSNINATVLRTLVDEVRLYVNEEVAAADMGAFFIKPNHVYRPDFFGGTNPHTTLTSGEVYFRNRADDVARAAYYSHYLGEDSGNSFFPIPGMNATIQVPEDINTNGGHRVRLHGSFYVYEYGGNDGTANAGMAESYTIGSAGVIGMLVDGTQVGALKPFYKGSIDGTEQYRAYYPRKQVSFLWSAALNEGVHTLGVGINPTQPSTDGLTKHCIVLQGGLNVPYWCR